MTLRRCRGAAAARVLLVVPRFVVVVVAVAGDSIHRRRVLGRVISRLGGAIIGPLMDGSVNALMTLKLGYLAKRRCRSFDVWSRASAMQATRDVFERVKKESAGLTSELVKLSGGVAATAGRVAGGVAEAATDAAGKVFAAPRSAWSIVQDAFVKKPAAKKQTRQTTTPTKKPLD